MSGTSVFSLYTLTQPSGDSSNKIASTQFAKLASLPSWVIKTAAYTASSGDFLLANTTAGSFTITLPASPTTGAVVNFSDPANSWGTNALVVAPNGSNIASSSSSFNADVSGASFYLLYVGGTVGWKPINGTSSVPGQTGTPGTQGVSGAISNLATTNPVMDGTATPGTTGKATDAGHVHPSDISRIAKAGDQMQGALDLASGINVNSGATTIIGAVNANFVLINGTATITAFDTAADGVYRFTRFTSAGVTLTHNAATLALPGSANIVTQANDHAVFKSSGAGVWRCISYTRADGTPLAINSSVPGLSTVATSGSFNDLLNKPTLATVANTGSYNDLLNRPLMTPQGRLTLVSQTPIQNLSTAVTGVTTIYYTPYNGNTTFQWNGTSFLSVPFTELSNSLTDATTNPSAAVANTVYDMFVWSNSGTMTLSRGPAWSAGATAGSLRARGAGAGSTALVRVNGVLVNQYAITNGPSAGYGVYVGTICTDTGAATLTMFQSLTQSSQSPSVIGVWNYYNRTTFVATTSNSQTHTTTAANSPCPYAASNTVNGSYVLNYVTGIVEDNFSMNFTTQSFYSTAIAGKSMYFSLYINSATTLFNVWNNGTAASIAEKYNLIYQNPTKLGFNTYAIYEYIASNAYTIGPDELVWTVSA